MKYNNAINPREDTYPVEVMPSRSSRIAKVTARKIEGMVGGCTDPATGQVWIPTGNTAKERTIRYHEALHAEFTPKKAVPRDMLDQALEDGRLHRHCSVSAKSKYFQARRDELAMALREVRQGLRMPVSPISNVVLFRALAILSASPMKDAHARLLDKAFSRRDKDSRARFDKALALLADYSNWDKARGVLTRYFGESPRGKEASTPSVKADKDESKPDKDTTPSKAPASDEDKEEDDTDEDGKDSTSEDKPDTDSDEDGDAMDSDSDSESDSDTDDSDSDTEADSGDSDEDSDVDSATIAPATDTKPTKAMPVHPDKYTADLTPECDKEAYEDRSRTHPLDLLIRRLDMGINRVKLSLGRKAPLPVTSGRQILARKLAGVCCNPTMRVFSRPVNQGGYGTILIDASGSMGIPESTLIGFLDKAPALTLAFYNAPSDLYGHTIGYAHHGNIYIYAANGYRAQCETIGYGACPDWGNGNMIDYQAMCWLIKQPAPHYLVTDQGWTGPWSENCRQLITKLRESKQVIVVRNLEAMEEIL